MEGVEGADRRRHQQQLGGQGGHRRIAGIERRQGFPQQQVAQGLQQRHRQGGADAHPHAEPRRPAVAAAKGPCDAQGHGLGDGQGHHEHQHVEAHGHPVGGHCHGAEGGHQQRDHMEEPRLGEDGAADGRPHGEGGEQGPPPGFGIAAQQPQLARAPGAADKEDFAADDQQHHRQGRPAAAGTPEGGQAPVAVDQPVIEGNVDEKPHEVEAHGHIGQAHALQAGAQGEHEGQHEGGGDHRQQVAPGHRLGLLTCVEAVHRQPAQGGHQRRRRESDGQRQPQAVVELAAQPRLVAGPVQPPHQGAIGDEHPHQEHHRQVEQGGPQGHPRQLPGAGATAHQHVGDGEADDGQLPHQEGQGQPHQVPELAPHGRPGHGAGGGGHGQWLSWRMEKPRGLASNRPVDNGPS
jgi:hypothetical protein